MSQGGLINVLNSVVFVQVYQDCEVIFCYITLYHDFNIFVD